MIHFIKCGIFPISLNEEMYFYTTRERLRLEKLAFTYPYPYYPSTVDGPKWSYSDVARISNGLLPLGVSDFDRPGIPHNGAIGNRRVRS